MTELFYAHSKDGEPPERWRQLVNHQTQVAELARAFAEEFKITMKGL